MHLPRFRPWRERHRAERRRVAAGAVVLAAAVAAAGAVPAATASGASSGVRRTDAFMTMPETPGSSRTVRIDTSFFTPSGGGRHPAVLLAHGFGGSKADTAGEAGDLARHGYAVLTWSARGFGRSTGAIGLDAPDREVADVRRLVDWLGHRPDVEQDGPDDPRVGITGVSYGGAVSLLAAGYDRRIDAIAPQIAWWDLGQALFPQNAHGEPAGSGVFKKLWAGVFVTTGSTGSPVASVPSSPGGGSGPGGGAPAGGSGGGTGNGGPAASGTSASGGRSTTTGTTATTTATTTGKRTGAAGEDSPADVSGTDGCRFTRAFCAVYRRVAVSGRADPAAYALLERSSPASVASRIRVPALIVQGQNDSLFPLDQGDEMARAIARNGAPVSVDWFSGGHDGGDQESGRVLGRVDAWFDRYLKHEDVNTGPAFRVTRSRGIDTTTGDPVVTGASAARYPGLDGTSRTAVRLSGGPAIVRNPAGGSPPALSGGPGLGALGQLSALGQNAAVDFPGQSASFASAPLRRAVTVTGQPSVRLTVSSDAPGGGAVLFGKVYDVGPDGGRTLPHQLAAPLRVTDAGGAGRAVTVTLPVVDHEFPAGHRVVLVLSATDLAYASPVEPATYRVAVDGGTVTLPVDTALRTAVPGTPVWVWLLPLAALAVAAALLATGRRRPATLPAAMNGTGTGPDAGRPTPAAHGAPPGTAAADGTPAPPRAPAPDDDPAPPGDSPVPPDGSSVPLVIRGLSKRYRGSQDRYAVRELSFRVERGQVLGLLGPNGAGKTTTMRMLMGLIAPDAGAVEVFGQPVAAGAPVLSRVGAFVEGAGFLPHLSGRANLELYWRATGRPAGDAHLEAALEIAGLGEALRRAVRTYSQGMRQRLAIAQAMLGLPDLLILDEPTNGLDPPQIREMRAVVGRYAATGRTVIVSSHLLSEVEQSCTHLVVMDKGRLVAAGPVAEIAGEGDALFVGVAAPADGLPEVAVALAALDGVAAAEAADGGLVVRLDGLTVTGLLAELLRLGLPVERVGPHRRLEDAFLTLIGGQA